MQNYFTKVSGKDVSENGAEQNKNKKAKPIYTTPYISRKGSHLKTKMTVRGVIEMRKKRMYLFPEQYYSLVSYSRQSTLTIIWEQSALRR